MKSKKLLRVFSMLLVLLLVLTLVPVTALAAAGKTVYFENTASWASVNIYYWSDSSTNYVSWPGKAMKLYEGKIYSYDLPEGVSYVIFNNGSSQTSDLTLPQHQNLYSYDTGSWSQYGCDHSWGEETVLTPATCTVGGEVSMTCSVCSETKIAAIDPLGHDYAGRICSRCGLSQTLIYFDSNGSGWSQPYIYTWSGSTTQCGPWPGVRMEAVEGEAGLFVYGLPEAPENVIFNNGNGGSGNQTADLKFPTDGQNCYSFTDQQWTKYDTCQHSWDQGSVVTAATCTEDGLMNRTCTLCGEIESQVIPALGHDFIDGSCATCGALQNCLEHTWDEGVVTKEQSCWLTGIRTYTCLLCGATKEEIIYAGHDIYVAQIIEPTCTSTGKEITKCTRCAYSYDKTIPRAEHSYIAGETIAPTCTQDGYTVYTCSVCSAEKQGDLVYHTGHVWDENTCTVCGTVCNHTYVNGICSACNKGAPSYVDGYYQIKNAPQLYWFAAQVNGGNNAINGKLVADIDLSNSKWTSIGYYLSDSLSPDTMPYTGTFDGQGYTVSNFVTEGTDNEGLFGYCSSATIMNLGIINAKVTGWRAGAIAGYALTSNVINCFAKDCTVIGKTTNSVALLSGTVYLAPVASPQGGIIRNCYAMDCTLIDETDLEVYASPVGGTDTQNGYYCNVRSDVEFSSVRNSTEVTLEQLTSGEVTYSLNQGVTDGTQGWYQTCGQGLPAHSGQTVYQVTGCGSSTATYSNDPNASADHSYEAVITAPTCDQPGYTTYTCATCGDSYIADEVAALGHNYETVTVEATCIEDGSITDTCSVCGDTKVEAIPATGHSFENGTCGSCGEADPDYVKPVVKPTLTLKAPTLEFKDMITVNAMFTAENIEDVVEMGMITYTEQVDEWSVETAAHVIPGTTYDSNTGRYIATSQGIHAKYLGDTVYLATYAKLTDGSCVYSKLASYSPVQYAASKLSGTDVKLKQLVVAMLNYGAAAQTHFQHNVENLANATLTAEQIALPESYRADMVSTVASPSAEKQGEFANNKGFAKRYPSISFEGAFCINYFFTPSYAPVDGITLYYWNEADFEAADVLSIENASGSMKLEGEGVAEYRGDILGISAKDLSKAVYVAAVYSDGTTTWTSGVLGYSIGAYCASQSTKGGTIADLAMATAVYGYQAKQYFG